MEFKPESINFDKQNPPGYEKFILHLYYSIDVNGDCHFFRKIRGL